MPCTLFLITNDLNVVPSHIIDRILGDQFSFGDGFYCNLSPIRNRLGFSNSACEAEQESLFRKTFLCNCLGQQMFQCTGTWPCSIVHFSTKYQAWWLVHLSWKYQAWWQVPFILKYQAWWSNIAYMAHVVAGIYQVSSLIWETSRERVECLRNCKCTACNIKNATELQYEKCNRQPGSCTVFASPNWPLPRMWPWLSGPKS